MARKLISDLVKITSRHFSANAESLAALDRAFHALLQIRRPDEATGMFQKWSSPRPRGAEARKSPRTQPPETFHLLEASIHLVQYILQTIAASRENIRATSPAIKASLEFIAQNQQEWLSVAQVAEEVDLSESYFKILFREEVGLPPAEYMLRQKVEAAKIALGDSECNITELAYRLGFSSSQYFATVFKRFTNQTPSDYMNGQIADLTEIVVA
jgi:AraC-like DNA-binding protein